MNGTQLSGSAVAVTMLDFLELMPGTGEQLVGFGAAFCCRMPTGRWQKMKDTEAVAEEIIIKQHLIDHAASLKPADKKVLQNQINQLLRYGFSKKY